MIPRHLPAHRWFRWSRVGRIPSPQPAEGAGPAAAVVHAGQPRAGACGPLQALLLAVSLAVSACAAPPREPGLGHLRPAAQPQGKPPELVDAPLLPPQPRPGRTKAEVY